MGGHVYWLEILSLLQYQTALREQHGIMKRMEAIHANSNDKNSKTKI